jgi:hypothetical protein
MSNPYRYEIKFILDQADLTSAMTWLYSSTSARSTYPPRFVNSIYFDDPGYSSVRDNLAGISDRKKIRLRWYHNDKIEDISGLKLEVKCRNGRLGNKESFDLKSMEDKLLELEYRKLSSEIEEHVGGHEDFMIDEYLSPSLHVSYCREYFEDMSGIRYTFDKPISFYGALPHSRIFQNTEIPYPNIIMEIKFDPNKKDEVSDMLRSLSLTPKRHSKYLVGLAAFGQAVYY